MNPLVTHGDTQGNGDPKGQCGFSIPRNVTNTKPFTMVTNAHSRPFDSQDLSIYIEIVF